MEEDKVLFLDLDIIFNSSLKELWDTNIDNYALAAVEEFNVFNFRPRIFLNEINHYINAGVILFNLKYIREHNLDHQMIKLIENMHGIFQNKM